MAKLIPMFISSIFVSCNPTTNSHQFKMPGNDKMQIFSKVINYDTSVNNIILSDTMSVLSNVGNIRSLFVSDYNRGEVVIIANNNKTQQLVMKVENGGYPNQFDYFIVEPSNPKSKFALVLDNESFIANKGAYIGMSETIFSQKYSDINFALDKKEDTTIYTFSNLNIPYRAKYLFIRKQLYSFQFGYAE